MGERGEGSKLWPPFSVTREPCSSLSQERNLKALIQCCFRFVHQVLLGEEDTVSVLSNSRLSGIHARICWGFTCLTLLVWWITAPDLRMPFGSAYLFFCWSFSLPGSCSSVLPLVLIVALRSADLGLPGDGGCCLILGCGTRSRVIWFSYFHVGLVCSLSPEQEGPGGVGVCVCVCVRVWLLADWNKICICHVFKGTLFEPCQSYDAFILLNFSLVSCLWSPVWMPERERGMYLTALMIVSYSVGLVTGFFIFNHC